MLGFGLSRKFAEMNFSVSESFAKVKSDTAALNQWVSYLYNQNQQLLEQNSVLKRLVDEQKLSLNELRVTLRHIPKTASEIRQLVDQFYNFEPLLQRIRQVEHKLEILEVSKFRPLVQQRASVSSVPSIQKESSALKEKIIRSIARNSKDYVKNLVLGLVHKYGRIGALQLREIVVDEQGLCSKSSFYRILEEMESEQRLHVVSDGRHTVYLASQIVENNS